MTKKFLRTYKEVDILEVKEHLLIYGDLTANCANCQEINIKLGAASCPQCKTEFTYIAFRNVHTNLPKLKKIAEERPEITLIDHDDFKKMYGAHKAENFLK